LLASTTITSTPSCRPISGNFGSSSWCIGFVGLINTAIRDACGTRSFSHWSCFPTKPSGTSVANPVTLPPGRARLSTSPSAIGSATAMKTSGTDGAAAWTASAFCGASATMTSGPKPDELGHERGDLLVPALRITMLDLEVTADDIAAFAQSLQQSLHRPGFLGDRENSDAMNRLVRAGVRCGQNKARRNSSEHEAAEHRR
jgi:hypothetical protein